MEHLQSEKEFLECADKFQSKKNEMAGGGER
jgi:hypothetical protein